MNTFVFLLFFVPLTLCVLPTPGEHFYQLDRPEGTRSFYVWVPKSYTGSVPYPIHFSWHGLGDTCQNYGPAVGFQQLAESYHFLYVYPCATNGMLGTGWNAGTCCLQPTTVDDVAFARSMLDLLVQSFNVDKGRVWSSGFSNGGMCFALDCDV